jgi:hypothetical protein
MDPQRDWTFEQYKAYERDRVGKSAEEQRAAVATGLTADPKSAPHGGYRVACTWSDEVTEQAAALSVELAALLPGTPAYPVHSIHSSIGNLRPAEDRLIDPGRGDDATVLDRLCDAVADVVRDRPGGLDDVTSFGPGYLAPRMAYVFGRPGTGYWQLYQAVHEASARRGVELVASWGPHLTLTRFAAPASPDLAAKASDVLASWRMMTSTPVSIDVGYYTVDAGSFFVTRYRSVPLG